MPRPRGTRLAGAAAVASSSTRCEKEKANVLLAYITLHCTFSLLPVEQRRLPHRFVERVFRDSPLKVSVRVFDGGV